MVDYLCADVEELELVESLRVKVHIVAVALAHKVAYRRLTTVGLAHFRRGRPTGFRCRYCVQAFSLAYIPRFLFVVIFSSCIA